VQNAIPSPKNPKKYLYRTRPPLLETAAPVQKSPIDKNGGSMPHYIYSKAKRSAGCKRRGDPSAAAAAPIYKNPICTNEKSEGNGSKTQEKGVPKPPS